MQFISASPRSHKVVCIVCGRKGYSARDPWAAACRQGHPLSCAVCGKRFADRYGQGQHARHTGHGSAS